MRLFHISEEPDIREFVPRSPTRGDLDPATALVWAVCERTLPNYMLPRDCPRVCWHNGPQTTAEDRAEFLPPGAAHVVTIEEDWQTTLAQTTLTVYEFDPAGFVLQDEPAGYYISTEKQVPIAKTTVGDLAGELKSRSVILQSADGLWEIGAKIQKTSLNWSMIRMKYAKRA